MRSDQLALEGAILDYASEHGGTVPPFDTRMPPGWLWKEVRKVAPKQEVSALIGRPWSYQTSPGVVGRKLSSIKAKDEFMRPYYEGHHVWVEGVAYDGSPSVIRPNNGPP